VSLVSKISSASPLFAGPICLKFFEQNENSSAALLRNKGLAKLAIGWFVKEEKRNVKS
jgi:hypothetical protein